MRKRVLAMAGVSSVLLLAACGGQTPAPVASGSVNAASGAKLVAVVAAAASSSSTSSSASSAASSSSAAPVNSAYVPAGYKLIWNDEFSTDGAPDPKKWGYDAWANYYDVSNGEKQYYAANRLQNAHVQGGYLYITAKKEDLTGWPSYQGQHYSSARLWTYAHEAWTYGFFEVRARMPCGAGSWPAIWTLGTNASWPKGGEIDIMEQLGRTPSTIYGTVHDSAYPQPGVGSTKTVLDACSNFHDYQMTWTADRIDIGIDGVVYQSYFNNHTTTDQWPFNSPQYLLLNVAMGGWGGTIDDTSLPSSMLVDYVRVYQK